MVAVSLLLLFTILPSIISISEATCPNNTFLGEYIEKLENATETVITDIQGIVGTTSGAGSNNMSTAAGPSNSTTLYNALTTSLNITPSTEGLKNFSKTLDVITDSYFKSCYGPVKERPKIEDSAVLLKEFVSLLENRTDIVKIRQLFGRLSCLQNFTAKSNTDLGRKKRESGMMPDLSTCAQAPTLAGLYDCLDSNNQFDCIFNLNDPINCGNSGQLSTKSKKHCLAFSVDTTGSMSDELASVRQVIYNFIQSEENEITLCYVMVPFNDFGYPAYPNLGNLDFAKVYDASCHSTDPQGCSFSMADGSPVYGVDILLNDVNGLTATGGADCPEYGMTSILKAIDIIDNINSDLVQHEGRHNLIVLTDASAKDNSLYQQVINTANSATKPDVSVHFFYSGGGCSGVGFGNYDDIKDATGGLSVSQINAANFQNFVNYIAASSESGPGDNTGTEQENNNPGPVTPSACQTFKISQFTTMFSSLLETTSSSVVITKPDGTTETVSTFANSFGVYKVTNPQPGNWKACVSSSYTLTQSLSATITLEMNIDYLKENSNGELLPTAQLPYACDSHVFTATTPDLSKISLDHPLILNIIDNIGNLLQSTELYECSGFFSGTYSELPVGLVQYQLKGTDSKGTSFTHTIPNSYITFDVPVLQADLHGTSATGTIVLNPGRSSLVRMSIRNTKSGPQNLQASAIINLPSEIQGHFLTDNFVIVLPDQNSKELQFMFNTPDTVPVGQELTWSINITDTCTNSTHIITYTAIVKESIPLNVTNTSTSSISFEWQSPIIGEGYNITNYSLTFDYNNGTVNTVNLSGDNKQYTATGLFPYQRVYASIIAYIDSGGTAEIAPISIITDEAEPGPVSQLNIKPQSTSSVNINWLIPVQQNGIILYYELSITGFNDTIILNSSVITNVTIEELEPYVRYIAIVYAATSAGKGEPVTVQFYSLEGIPVESPYYTDHLIMSPNSLKFEWSPPSVEDRKGFITNYTVLVEYMEDGKENRKEYITNKSSVYISGVPDFADLNISISASTIAGQGPFSEPEIIHITTGVPSAPENVTGTVQSNTAVELYWDTPESPNGKILHYEVYYKQSEHSTYSIIQNMRMTLYDDDNDDHTISQNYFTVENLDTGEDYHFIIAAVNYAGNGMNSSEIIVSLPSSVSLLAATLPVVLIVIAVVVSFIVIFTVVLYYRKQKKANKNDYDIYENFSDEEFDSHDKVNKGFVEEKVDFYEEIALTQSEI